MTRRWKAIREAMAAAGESAFLVTEAKNRRYLSGFSGSSGWLLFTPSEVFLLTDGRYWEQVGQECPGVTPFRYTVQEHRSLTGALAQLLKATLPEQPTLGLEIDEMPISLHRSLCQRLHEEGTQIQEVEGRVRQLRQRKEESELRLLQQAASLADQALAAALERLEPGMTEARWRAEIDYQVLRHGGDGAAFPTIVASGVQGSYPHAGASDKVITAGELITVDFGAIWKGYCSDMTRTLWFGELSDRDRGLVQAVLRAQAASVAAARPGLTTGELDEVARSSLRQEQLDRFFIHSLGHGIGLDVHESPTLRSGQTDRLEEGQVITLEPGVYLPGETGCRIEDTVVLEGSGCLVLNRFPKQAPDETRPRWK